MGSSGSSGNLLLDQLLLSKEVLRTLSLDMSNHTARYSSKSKLCFASGRSVVVNTSVSSRSR